jgi:type I restriction-modification system DNA methylase subunit
MIRLWYDFDEVNEFHPVVSDAINNAMDELGYSEIAELIHHPAIPNSTIIPDFAIKLKTSGRYVFVIEVKKNTRDVNSQRYQNQTRSYVSDFSPYWEPNYPKYFCLTNVEELILFAERQGPISTCILKNNPKSHSRFLPQTKDASQTVIDFKLTMLEILPLIFNRVSPQWDNNWQPLIDSFYQNYISIRDNLIHSSALSEELTLYELFRLLAFTYLKDYYSLTRNDNQSYFRNLPPDDENLVEFKRRLENNYNRVLALDFNQVFRNHPNPDIRIFPEKLTLTLLQYFKDNIRTLASYGSQAIADNSRPEYIFNLLTSKIYDKEIMHKKGKIMSDMELSYLLAEVTIENENSSIIDPCCGDGALLDAAYDKVNLLSLSNGNIKTHNTILNQLSGIEIDPFLAQLTTFRLVSKSLNEVNTASIAQIEIGNTFLIHNNQSYDVILMNPPFLRNDNDLALAPISDSDKIQMLSSIDTNCDSNFVRNATQPNLYFYFVNYIWHFLNSNGKAGLILMAKYLNSADGEYLKSYLLNKVDSIILYPRNYFEDFKVTTVITVLSKQPSANIKFLRIKNEDLLSEPSIIKSILSTENTTITANYSIKVVERNTINPADNWKLHFNDPEDNYATLDELPTMERISTFFTVVQRGGAGNTGGSNIIYPNFAQTPYSDILDRNKGFGIKNSRHRRNLILTQEDLSYEKAIHFPGRYDDNSMNGLSYNNNRSDQSLSQIYTQNNTNNSAKWKKIVNSSFNSIVEIDILIPRAERTKHGVYLCNYPDGIVLSTNFFYLSGLVNSNPNIGDTEQIKFIAAFLNSCFGQIQFEINSNNQEGMRKLEGFHIGQLKVPDLRVLDELKIRNVNNAFDIFNRTANPVSGDEGLHTPRRNLEK